MQHQVFNRRSAFDVSVALISALTTGVKDQRRDVFQVTYYSYFMWLNATKSLIMAAYSELVHVKTAFHHDMSSSCRRPRLAGCCPQRHKLFLIQHILTIYNTLITPPLEGRELHIFALYPMGKGSQH